MEVAVVVFVLVEVEVEEMSCDWKVYLSERLSKQRR